MSTETLWRPIRRWAVPISDRQQIQQLNAETKPSAPSKQSLKSGEMELNLEPNALVLIELKPGH